MHTLAFTSQDLLALAYLFAAALFIVGMKMLSKVKTAAKGNLVSAVGMLVAVVATFFVITGGTAISLVWIVIGLALGGGIGLVLATKVQMTSMPQMVALLNGFGGVSSLLVAGGEYARATHLPYDGKYGSIYIGDDGFQAFTPYSPGTAEYATFQEMLERIMGTDALIATGLAVLIGGVTFTGSLMAFGKLQGCKWAPDQPVQFAGQKFLIGAGLILCLALTICLASGGGGWAVLAITLVSLILGVLLVVGIGGADMPVVVALLNSYSGLAAAMAGFVLGNYALIITGSLVGASGLILTNIMCKAMNRSLTNVLFGGVGGAPGSGASAQIDGEANPSNPEDASLVLDAARSVIIVPGYGMAVAQAQHAVKELAAELDQRGIDVQFAIHPVAGRMPGHMNVLLAEAGVPYEQLRDLDQINDQFSQCDVALVIGANDVTNPDARTNESSPLYGMPILDVDAARTVYVIKRSLNPGFAGIQNPLYFLPNTRMLFGDAKGIVQQLVDELTSIA